MFLIYSCQEKKTKKTLTETTQNKSIIINNKESEEIADKQLISKAEKEKDSAEDFDKYFTSFNDSVVSLCCMDKLYNPFGFLSESSIKKYLPNFIVTKRTEEDSKITIFKNGKDSVSLVNWKDTYSENNTEIFLGKGQLTDKNIQLRYGIKIGMTKQEFMDNFFQFSDSIINRINIVSVCQDERGDSFTKYKFNNDTLSIIKFGEWEE